jgi:hypothetical protein
VASASPRVIATMRDGSAEVDAGSCHSTGAVVRRGRLELGALIAIAALLLAGCLSLIEGETVSTHAQTLPESERAVLLGRSEWFLLYAFDVSIWSVGGVIGSGPGERRWEVAPGRRAVEIDQWGMIGGMGGKARYGFELEMRAGHRYQIQGVRQQPGCVVEIEELLPDQEAGTVMQVPCEERSGTRAPTGGDRGGGKG